MQIKRRPTGVGYVGQKECSFHVALRKKVGKESKKSVIKYSQLSNMLVPSLFLSVLTQSSAAAVEFRVVRIPMKSVFKAGPSETLPVVAAFLCIESGSQG